MGVTQDIAPPPNVVPHAPRAQGLAALNAGAIVVAGLYLGRDLLVPIVLAVLLAFVLAPLAVLLQRARIGRGPSVFIAVALAFVVFAGVGAIVAGQATTIAERLPAYQETIQQKMKSLAVGGDMLEKLAQTVNRGLTGGEADPAPPPATPAPARAPATAPAPASSATAAPAASPAAPATLDAKSAFSLARTVIAPVFGPLATFGVVAIFAVFVLLAREDLRDRLVRLLGRRDLHRTILALNDAARRLSRYFLFQLLLNAGFGLFVGCGLWVVGLPGPALWGIIAGLMRFVPFIGTAISVIPPVLLAVIVAPGWSLAFIVLGLFILTDVVVSQAIEPLLYGHSTGLSPIAIILSAAFWAFLWGPVGLLLATPLTVCLVVLGRYVEPLAFLEVMLGDQPPLEPAETFYQRALEGNGRELANQARLAVEASSLPDYYDRVAMQGLALAQADLARDALAFERLEGIHAQIEALLTALATLPPAAAAPPPPAGLAGEWRIQGSVAVIPGRGQLDGLAATMAAQVLQGAGFGADVVPNAALGAGQGNSQGHAREGADAAAFSRVAMCCLSVLETGSTASGIRYLLRRIQRQMPGAVAVVCLWHAPAQSALLQALREEGGEEMIVLSLTELVALARALSARVPQQAA